MRIVILALLLTGCASSTPALYESVQHRCPVDCTPSGWTGNISVGPEFLICVCNEN